MIGNSVFEIISCRKRGHQPEILQQTEEVHRSDETKRTCSHVNKTPVRAYEYAQDMHIHEDASQGPLGKCRFK